MYLLNSKIATIKWTGFPAARTGCVGCRICPWLLVWCHMALRSSWSLGSVWLSPTQAHLPAEVWAGGKDKGKAKEKELASFSTEAHKNSDFPMAPQTPLWSRQWSRFQCFNREDQPSPHGVATVSKGLTFCVRHTGTGIC